MIKTFYKWLNEQSSVQQKPILFVGNNSAIIPSDHEMGIKVPDSQTIQKLKPMANSVYYEGTGERGQGGRFESSWVQKNLGISPKNVNSYDKIGEMYKNVHLGPAVVLYSNLNVNEIFGQNFSGGTVRDAIISALAKGGPEGSVTDPAKVREFIDICEKEVGKEQLDLPSSNYTAVAKAIEKAMWPLGSDFPGNGPLGRLADQVEKERRSMIVNMASINPGLYFLGSGHLDSMKAEHGLESDI